jgi:MSHA biogenesis protein MshJ
VSTVTSLHDLKTQLKARWRTARRAFDARQLSERRLLIVAMVALMVFAMDTLWLTPTLARYKAATKRQQTAMQARDALHSDANRRLGDMQRRQDEARVEIQRLAEMLADQDRTLEQQQAVLAPAREMRVLLEGLLEETPQLKVKAVRTLPPQEVKLKTVAAEGRQPLLYRQSMEIVLQGGYAELVRWLHSVETMPRRVLWDSIRLSADEHAVLSLALTVHTFSPDRDALEIAP